MLFSLVVETFLLSGLKAILFDCVRNRGAVIHPARHVPAAVSDITIFRESLYVINSIDFHWRITKKIVIFLGGHSSEIPRKQMS